MNIGMNLKLAIRSAWLENWILGLDEKQTNITSSSIFAVPFQRLKFPLISQFCSVFSILSIALLLEPYQTHIKIASFLCKTCKSKVGLYFLKPMVLPRCLVNPCWRKSAEKAAFSFSPQPFGKSFTAEKKVTSVCIKTKNFFICSPCLSLLRMMSR